MGERFLQIGCHDRALLAGLAAKVGLSGSAAVAAFDARQAALAESIGRKVGALIDVKQVNGADAWPFDASAFDMVVVDDTEGRGLDRDITRHALGSLRAGGRLEVITPVNASEAQVDYTQLLADAGCKPVRVLAERDGLRFVEGLRPTL
jgi:hypothetical protein